MRAKNYMNFRWLSVLLAMPLLWTSCSNDEGTTVSNDYCYIRSVTLGTVKRNVEKRDRLGNVISTTPMPYTAGNYAMTIDHRAGLIENRDSLPYGSDLSAVLVTISFDGNMVSYREKGTDALWLTYNSADSLNLTKPLELNVLSNDGQSSRIYTFKVNVHRQEGDSLYWKQCESEVEPLTGLTDMKAFTLNDKLMVLGQKTAGISLAERSTTDVQGTWTEQATNLPLTADLQTLRQQGSKFYLSTRDGSILSSDDAKNWQQVGATYANGLTLVEKTADYFYAISEGKMLRSADAESWEEDKLDTDADMLPDSGIRSLTVQQNNDNTRIILVGQKDGNANASVWNKMWNEGEPEADAEWIYFPVSPDNKIPCPRLQSLNLISYDGKCIAFGGASDDGSHTALDAMYISQDYGITWRPSTELHTPALAEGTSGCITSTVDKNYFIWIITDAQVWRGRLNRLGFEQQ